MNDNSHTLSKIKSNYDIKTNVLHLMIYDSQRVV